MRVITLSDDAALLDYAKPIVHELRANMVRVEADFSATPIKAKMHFGPRIPHCASASLAHLADGARRGS